MSRFTVHESAFSRISQAYGFKIPGYLIVEPVEPAASLASLSPAGLADFAECLALAERLVRDITSPERVYVLKFGESEERVHFHVVPRTKRVLDGYLRFCDDSPPWSGARITDWLWFHGEELAFTTTEIDAFVREARDAAERILRTR